MFRFAAALRHCARYQDSGCVIYKPEYHEKHDDDQGLEIVRLQILH